MKKYWQNLSKTTRESFITYAFVIAAYLLIMALSSAGMVSNLIRGQLVPICAYVVMAISLNLTVGVLGELSLGHGGFMSIGAFSGAIMATVLAPIIPNKFLLMLVVFLFAAAMAAIAGVLVGVPVLRLNGDYLAIVTLAFGEIIKGLINTIYVGLDSNGLHFAFLKKMPLAEGGRMLLQGPMGLTGIRPISNFTMGFVLIMICLVIIYNLVNSRTGRAIMAIRDNKIAAQSIGISVNKFKLMTFVISASMAGAAGSLFVMNYTTMQASKFDFNTSILVLVFVVLGGLGNMRGSIIAATLLTVLPELLRAVRDYRMLLYAVVLIVVMLATHSAAGRQMTDKISGKIGAVFDNVKYRIFRKAGDK
ncbi:MAG: branched-chain amino acid ABC transporter permease [Firmicutes bacterium]|nr:branched-chain amino acid ABC transporter permease [Bacillota bacterium]